MQKDLFEVINDENNCDPIAITLKDGTAADFEQIATVPYKDETYCILRPLNTRRFVKADRAGRPYFADYNAAEDTGYVFRLQEKADGGGELIFVKSRKIINAVFEIYGKLVDEANEEDDDDEFEKVQVSLKGGEEATFEKVAEIRRGDKEYAILRPTEPNKEVRADSDGVPYFADNADCDGASYVFRLKEERKRKTWVCEINPRIIEEVFAIYGKLSNESDPNGD